ncbi:MAG TPA: deoxyribodipyrimidine photo-lyase [Nocardioidaceae bacterium]|nr:deoxyribodipyrimidine photo-lyase [Nocardioidaceae bacterium]
MGESTAPTVMWFRRDLRLEDNPALLEACDGSSDVLLLFVVDPHLWGPAGPARRAYLAASLAALDESVGGRLVVRRGDPVEEVVRAAKEIGARSVHVAADFGPYGSRRDEDVASALAEEDIELRRTGSPYAVAPGCVVNGSGEGYKVFTPFARAWAEHGWRAPAGGPSRPQAWLEADSDGVPDAPVPEGMDLPEAGEKAARRRWKDWLDRVADYDTDRDRPDLDATSHMSVHLKWGEIHPRTLLADLAPLRSNGSASYRSELSWREFYADVLHRNPETAREYLRREFAHMEYDEPGDDLAAWQEGRTGYPIVDAGMRQLRQTGWMHNRVRMIVASFLVKDLHLEWQHGARHFMHWLVDGDLASNQHGWQWVAGCGTDAAPYFRVFNPTTQGAKFDPDGDYVRRWVEELAEVDKAYIHDPSKQPGGLPDGYPPPLLDHAEERREALARLERMKS